MNEEIIMKNKVTLCGRGNGKCCPVMEQIDENRVKITDDDGNSIIITKEQANLMANGVTSLEQNREKLLFD